MFSLFQGAKLVQKLVLKKYVFVNLFIKFLKVKRGVIFRLSFAYPSLIVRSKYI